MRGTAHQSPHCCLGCGRNALGGHRVGELQQARPPGIKTCWRCAHDTVIRDRDSVIVGPYEYDPVPAGALGSVQRRVSPAEKPRQPGVDFPVGGDADTHGGAHRKSAHEAGGFGKLRPQTLRRLDGFFTVYARLERVYSNPMQAKQAILAEAPVRQLS